MEKKLGAAGLVAMVGAMAGPEALASVMPRGRKKRRIPDREAQAMAKEKRKRRALKRRTDAAKTLEGRKR